MSLLSQLARTEQPVISELKTADAVNQCKQNLTQSSALFSCRKGGPSYYVSPASADINYFSSCSIFASSAVPLCTPCLSEYLGQSKQLLLGRGGLYSKSGPDLFARCQMTRGIVDSLRGLIHRDDQPAYYKFFQTKRLFCTSELKFNSPCIKQCTGFQCVRSVS